MKSEYLVAIEEAIETIETGSVAGGLMILKDAISSETERSVYLTTYKDQKHLDMYRHILCELCKQNGNHLYVDLNDLEAGSLMYREDDTGVELRFEKDIVQ